MKGKSVLAVILRLAWMAFFYHKWKARMSRIFGQNYGDVQEVYDRICADVLH